MNGAFAGAPGVAGGAFGFDGVDDGLYLGNVSDLDFGANDSFTFEGWIYPESPTSYFSQTILHTNYPCGPTSQSLAFRTTGRASFFVRDSSSNFRNLESDPLPFGEWHHLVGVREVGTGGKFLHLYVNGELAVSVPDPTVSTLASNTEDVIGRNSPCSSDITPVNGFA